MGLFKADFYRFFVIGFAVGAGLVFTTMDGSIGSSLADGMVAPARAETVEAR